MAAPLRSDAQRNRARVLKAAQEAFASEGLAVPLDEIARRAGVGSGTVYRHFSSKEVLFEVIILGRLQQLVDQAEQLIDAAEPAEALLTFLSLTIEEGSVRKDMMDALAGDDIEPSAAVPQARLHLRRVIGKLLFQAQQVGAIRDDISVADLMALITGLILARHRNDGGMAGPQRVLGVVWDGLRAGCSGPVTRSPRSPRADADRAAP
ncbi:TetR/AcrR family transcriptional regulator [Streptomyces sp. NBRC 110028]|uniref:TetR/AcrR family transcriptional regulator n=1 Tax=Streptomyces sp. NBRC 110028 TaxID=1621260 RepID=UPI0007C83853|nr:TetR/AcrR family transcriptional regulator [Streptomyces sp. NBRC 110028]